MLGSIVAVAEGEGEAEGSALLAFSLGAGVRFVHPAKATIKSRDKTRQLSFFIEGSSLYHSFSLGDFSDFFRQSIS